MKYTISDAKEALTEGIGIAFFAAFLGGGLGMGWFFCRELWRAVFR